MSPHVIACTVHDEETVTGRVDVAYVVDGLAGECAVYLPICRDDVEVHTFIGPRVTEWDEWLIEAAQVAYDRSAP